MSSDTALKGLRQEKYFYSREKQRTQENGLQNITTSLNEKNYLNTSTTNKKTDNFAAHSPNLLPLTTCTKNRTNH